MDSLDNSNVPEGEHIIIDISPIPETSILPLITRPKHRPSRFHDLYLFLYSLIVMSLSCVSCSLAVAYTNYIDSTDYPNYKPRLHDIIIDHIPPYVETFKFTEYSIQGVGVYFILLLAVHKSRLQIMRRYLLVMSSIYALRSLCLLSTQLSVPHTRSICPEFTNYGANEILSLASSAAITFGMVNRGMLSCGDYLFSGHTAAILTLSLFITYYSCNNIAMLFVIWCVTVAGIICIVTSFMHYTIDVLIAIFVTLVIFSSYHIVTQIMYTYNRGSRDSSMLEKLSHLRRFGLYCNLMAYVFEANALEFENEYEIWFTNCYEIIVNFFNNRIFRRVYIRNIPSIDIM